MTICIFQRMVGHVIGLYKNIKHRFVRVRVKHGNIGKLCGVFSNSSGEIAIIDGS